MQYASFNYREGREYSTDPTHLTVRNPDIRFYSPGYEQFGKPRILQLRRYLDEKIQMGFLGELQLYRDKNPNMISFFLCDIYPRLWEDVVRPGIEDYVDIRTITTYRSIKIEHISLDIRVKEKES